MTAFKPTHRITVTPLTGTPADHWFVMLVDGVGYTFVEWSACEHADWELVDGEWRFQGDAAPWNGIVTVITL